jgi:hypothetical protein
VLTKIVDTVTAGRHLSTRVVTGCRCRPCVRPPPRASPVGRAGDRTPWGRARGRVQRGHRNCLSISCGHRPGPSPGHGAGSFSQPTPPASYPMKTCLASRWLRISADQADARDLLAWRWSWRPGRPVRLAVVTRPEGTQGFSPLPTRWMVARTFGWCGRDRRWSNDDE